MLEVFKPEALNYFNFSRPILLTLSAFRNPISTHLSLSGFLDSMLCVVIVPTLLSSDTTHASSGVVIFVRQGLFSSELSTSSLSSLDPYSDYVGINTSLNNSSSLSFLIVYASPICSFPTDGRTDSFSPSFFSSSRNLFILRDFNCHHPLWDSRGTSDPRREEVFDWVISSDLLPLNDPDTPTLLHRSSGSRSSPDISLAPLLLLFLAPERCYRTLVLTIYQFFYLSLSLRSFAPTSAPPLQFSESSLGWVCLLH